MQQNKNEVCLVPELCKMLLIQDQAGKADEEWWVRWG